MRSRARSPHAAGFSCLPRACDVLNTADAAEGFRPVSDMCSAPLSGVRTECGTPFAGWQDVAVLVMLPSKASLRELLRAELGARGCDELTCVDGVLWNVSAFARAKVVLLSDRQSARQPEPTEVALLRALGVSVTHEWFDLAGAQTDVQARWFKMHFALRRARDVYPSVQYVVKVDTDTILFPRRLLAFLETLSAAAGSLQPVYFGSFDGASDGAAQPAFFQWHAYGLNRALLDLVLLEKWQHRETSIEDFFLGRMVEQIGAFFVHCGNFVSYAPSYVKPAGSPVYPLAATPITLHKAHTLTWRRKRQIPHAVCKGAGWNCRNESGSAVWMHVKQFIV